MAKFLIKWSINPSVPPQTDAMERLNGNKALLGFVLKDLEEGKLIDWGAYPSGRGGDCIAEGEASDILMVLNKYMPWAIFEPNAIMTAKELGQTFDKMASA